MIEVLQYLDGHGQSPFREWFDRLNVQAAAKVTMGITRLSLGNMSNVKALGAGVTELKIDFGPGYRVYFGNDGAQLVILLAGGSKQRQQRDIALAQARWQDYRNRKKERKGNGVDEGLQRDSQGTADA